MALLPEIFIFFGCPSKNQNEKQFLYSIKKLNYQILLEMFLVFEFFFSYF